VRLLLGLFSLGILGLVLYMGGMDAWRQVLRADLRWVGLAFACTALLTYVSAMRWALIANALAGTRLCSTRAYYHYLMMGKTVGLVLPEAVGVYTIGPLNMKLDGQASFKLAFGSLFLDKLFDIGLSGILLVPTAAYVLHLISLPACAALFGLFFAGLAVVLIGWYGPLLDLGFRLRDRVRNWKGVRNLKAWEALGALRHEQAPPQRVALAAYGLTVVRYLFMTARFAAVSLAVGVAVPPLLVFVGIPIAQLGLLLAVTPGALGALEAGWLGVLLLAGLPRQDIATFLIGQRAALFAFIFALGALSYLGSLIVPLRKGSEPL
jgi:uncharacterized membrane protein YbhN (UPF0104 family)